jgi:hypothetical protein
MCTLSRPTLGYHPSAIVGGTDDLIEDNPLAAKIRTGISRIRSLTYVRNGM